MRQLSQPISKYFASFGKREVFTPPQRLLVRKGRVFATAIEPSLATAAKETEEVRKMDSLLGVVRKSSRSFCKGSRETTDNLPIGERSNPAYRS